MSGDRTRDALVWLGFAIGDLEAARSQQVVTFARGSSRSTASRPRRSASRRSIAMPMRCLVTGFASNSRVGDSLPPAPSHSIPGARRCHRL